MSGFAADWLDLREPLDAASRSLELCATLLAWRRDRGMIRVIDLGAGTGANPRYLAPRLGGHQRWILLDQDPALLVAVESRMSRWAPALGLRFSREGHRLRLAGAGIGCLLESRRLDLARDLSSLSLLETDLVTASALLDLVSEPWLSALANGCAEAGAAVLFALSYDGRIAWDPTDPADETLRRLVNLHQRGDKGFGPALGPEAGEAAVRLFRQQGYRVRSARSDWRLGPGEAGLQRELAKDWARAAAEVAPDLGAEIAAWRARREALIANARSRLTVGHLDLLAEP